MKLTSILCTLILVTLGICSAVYAFSGFNLLYFMCFKLDSAYRSFLAVSGVSALYIVYSLIAFKPYKGLK